MIYTFEFNFKKIWSSAVLDLKLNHLQPSKLQDCLNDFYFLRGLVLHLSELIIQNLLLHVPKALTKLATL
jgi:hypothetical protein